MQFEPRYYQVEADEAIQSNLQAGVYQQLLCMATGTGKTEVFARLAQTLNHILPGQMMVLVHTDVLAQQAIKKIKLRNPSLNVQLEAGKHYADPDADVIVASVQTLGRKGTERVNRFTWSNITKLVVDEAHHGIADGYQRVYKAGGYLEPWSKRLLLGVTATPTRGDGQGLASVYKKIVYTYTLRQGVDDNFLAEPVGIRVDTKTSLDGVSTSGGEYKTSELAKEINNPVRNHLVAIAYQEYGEGRKAVGFCANIQHAQDLAEVFRQRGINAEAIWGEDENKNEKLKLFTSGKIKILLNAQLLTEGFDEPSIECVILASPTKSGVTFAQRVGRGTRLYPGKTDCIVIDVCDLSTRHSLVTLPTLIGLPSGLNLQGRGLVASARAIEEVLKEYPHLDLTGLTDITNLEAFVQEVNLFEVKFRPEVETNSEYTWYPMVTGGYRIMLPDKDWVKLEQNLLDTWELRGNIKGKKYRGERSTMAEAFSAADGLIAKVVPEAVTLLKRKAHWHEDAATPKQMKMLRKFFKGKQIPPDITKGEASKLIGEHFASKG
jgi:ATP-dependent helicase IRC3